jgi:prepilin-type N-terminal cleavage/methylation domain-containing protein
VRRSRGFTLIELLVATAIAMAMAALATTALIQVRKMIMRAEATLAMNTQALSIYSQLDRQLGALQQSCAIAITSTATTGTTGGEVRLIFMRGKDELYDYALSMPNPYPLNSDLVWQEWDWQQTTQAVATASSSPNRSFSAPTGFKPKTNLLQYQGFEVVPQPRRILSATSPTMADPGGLDDNIWFRNPITATGSLCSPADVGDFSDLQNNLVPCTVTQVSDWSLQLVAHNGTVTTIDDSASTTVSIPGVWLDGRMVPPAGLGSTLTDAVDFAHSPVPARPRVLRLRFTLTDAKAVISRTFSFSFALPGLSPEQ